jgi:hypothetical protein
MHWTAPYWPQTSASTKLCLAGYLKVISKTFPVKAAMSVPGIIFTYIIILFTTTLGSFPLVLT